MTGERPGPIGTRADFARELSALRESRDLTVRQVATRVAVVGTHSTIGDWFAGRALPSPSSQPLLVKVLRVCGVDDDEEIGRWLSAWRQVRRAPGRRPGREPYRGLAAFRTDDAEWFFGRDDLVAQLVDRVATLRRAGGGLQLVVGASGSGKSSLLRAGLVPAITAEPAGPEPAGPEPADSGPAGTEPADAGPAVTVVVPGVDPLDTLAGQVDPAARVVVVDQFEQVFAAGHDEQRAMVTWLRERVARGAVVVLGVRADFYAQVLAYPDLLAATAGNQLTVGPMTDAQLRQVITEPARKAQVEMEDGLVELLLREVAPRRADAAGPSGGNVLPLLAHALYQTWLNSPGGRMTIEAYRTAGGIDGAVATTADQAYESLTDGQRHLARRLFLPLVHLGTDSPDTRRRVPAEELLAGFAPDEQAEARRVLDTFVDQRMVTVDEVAVEISHDALLHAWPTLRSWIDEDRAGTIVGQRLAVAARQWQDDRRDSSALYAGGRLAAAQEWQRTHPGDAPPLLTEFLAASTRHARRRARRLYQLVAVLAVLLLTAVAAAGYGFTQRQAAIGERDRAVSRLIAGQAQRLRDYDPALAMQLSLAAYQISPTVEARSSLLDATVGPGVTRLLGFTKAAQAASYSPDGTVLAATGLDGTVRLWDTHTAGLTPVAGAVVPVSGQSLFALAFSSDGATLAVAGAEGTVTLWHVADPYHLTRVGQPLTGPTSTVYALAFAGSTLIAGSNDTRVWRWNVSDPSQPRPLPALAPGVGPVQAVAVDPTGTLLAAGGAHGQVQIYRDGTQPVTAGPMSASTTGKVLSLAFSHDGRILAAGASDALVHLWDLRDPGHPTPRAVPLAGPNSWVNALAFSPDDQSLAGGSSDKTVALWRLDTGAVTLLLPHPTPVTAVAFHGPDTLATASADGAVRVWSIPGTALPGTDAVFNAGFTHDGHLLVTADHSGTIRLWDVSAPGHARTAGPDIATPAGAAQYSGTAAIDPSGTTVAIGTRAGPVQLWDTTDPAHPKLGPLLDGPTELIESLAFSPTSGLLAAAGDDGNTYLWDLDTTDRPTVIPGTGGQILAIAFSTDGRLLATADTNGHAHVWDLGDPHHPAADGAPLGGFDGYAYSVAFTPDGRTLAVGSADTTIRLWDLSIKGQPKPIGGPLRGPTSYIYWLSFRRDGRQLAAAVSDGTLWIWQTDPGHAPTAWATLTRPRAALYTTAYSPDGHTLEAAGADDTTRLWETDPRRVAARICATAGTPVTPAEWSRYIPGVAYHPPCP